MIRRTLVVCLASAGLAVEAPGCGGSSSTSSSGTTASTTAALKPEVWASKTQALCRAKRTALARLGGVHITNAGIAQEGLPAVKRKLVGYLTKLIALLKDFSGRQQELTPPASAALAMQQAAADDQKAQSATVLLRNRVAAARTASALSAAFRVWGATLQKLAVRGEAIAERLNLPDCKAGSGASP
jgi:hypothetical protein